MTDAYQNRIGRRCAPASIWCDRSWFLPPLQLDFLAFMNDLNGGGAEDFLHWAVPEESTLSWMP
jgi:hypothetical protein